MPRRRTPKSYYFSRLYSAPFHENVKRIDQANLRNFDPFMPENRQTVANCKKHRRQRHELSDKCKHVLAIVDSQERLLAVKAPEQAQQAGETMQETEISIEFGDGIPEMAKEYVKYWISNSGMVSKPHARVYDVHEIKDEHNHHDRPSVVMLVPFADMPLSEDGKLDQVFEMFMEYPREFAKQFKVGNVRVYSQIKASGEDDALGLKQFLPLKIVGKEIIGKNLQKNTQINKALDPAKRKKYANLFTHAGEDIDLDALSDEQLRALDGIFAYSNSLQLDKDNESKLEQEVARRADILKQLNDARVLGDEDKLNALMEKYKISDEERFKQETEDVKTRYVKAQTKVVRSTDSLAAYKKKAGAMFDEEAKKEILTPLEEQLKVLEAQSKAKRDAAARKTSRDKENKIISDAFKNVIAPNRVNATGYVNPIGWALQIAETGPRAIKGFKEFLDENQKLKEEEMEHQAKSEIESLKQQIKDAKAQPAEPVEMAEMTPEEQTPPEQEVQTKTGSQAIRGPRAKQRDEAQQGIEEVVDYKGPKREAELAGAVQQAEKENEFPVEDETEMHEAEPEKAVAKSRVLIKKAAFLSNLTK